jgi:prepilin-type N-terminal cleavage/methylation domain-containing protein
MSNQLSVVSRKSLVSKRGFTLLELLIVISIIAILSLILIFALNPAEILRKARDTQRVSDLNTIKTALAVYVTSTSTPQLDGATNANVSCKAGAGAGTWNTADKIWYSLPTSAGTVAGAVDATVALTEANVANPGLIDSTGWIPVNLETLTAGSPISKFPIDPLNTITTVAAPTNSDFVYRYVCNASSTTFEIDAQLESNEYTVTNNLRSKDGGDNDNLYEEGTNLKILGNTNTY